jgi:hypothetical protein
MISLLRKAVILIFTIALSKIPDSQLTTILITMVVFRIMLVPVDIRDKIRVISMNRGALASN